MSNAMTCSKLFSIFSGNTCLGYVDFFSADEGMSVYLGTFRPTQNYAKFEHIFQMYAEHFLSNAVMLFV